MGSGLLDEYFFDGLRSDVWYVENPDLGMTWDTITVGPGQQRSVWMNMSDYDPAANQKDRLISPAFQFHGYPEIYVGYAYRPLGPISFLHDTFRIYVSTDCGQHFDHLLFEAFGDQLATTPNYGSNFYPTSAQDWDEIIVQALGDSMFPVSSSGWHSYDDYLVFAFETTNRKGNNFFLRNITILQTWISAESFTQDFRLFPNPSSGRFELYAEGQEGRTFSWSLLDMQGRNLRSGSFVGGRCVFDLANLSDGVYQLTLSNSDRTETHRLVKASD